jgi:hypothetical protein
MCEVAICSSFIQKQILTPNKISFSVKIHSHALSLTPFQTNRKTMWTLSFARHKCKGRCAERPNSPSEAIELTMVRS